MLSLDLLRKKSDEMKQWIGIFFGGDPAERKAVVFHIRDLPNLCYFTEKM